MNDRGEPRHVLVSTRMLVLTGMLLMMVVAAGVFGGQLLFKGIQTPPAEAQTRSASAFPDNIWFFAEGYTGPGCQTFLSVFNPGWMGADADVEVTLIGSNGEFGKVRRFCAASTRTTFDINAEAAKFGYSGDVSIQVIAFVPGASDPSMTRPIVCERPMYFDLNGIQGGTTSTGYVESITL